MRSPAVSRRRIQTLRLGLLLVLVPVLSDDGVAVRTDGNPVRSEFDAERECGSAGCPIAIVQARQVRARRVGEPVPHHDETPVGESGRIGIDPGRVGDEVCAGRSRCIVATRCTPSLSCQSTTDPDDSPATPRRSMSWSSLVTQKLGASGQPLAFSGRA